MSPKEACPNPDGSSQNACDAVHGERGRFGEFSNRSSDCLQYGLCTFFFSWASFNRTAASPPLGLRMVLSSGSVMLPRQNISFS